MELTDQGEFEHSYGPDGASVAFLHLPVALQSADIRRRTSPGELHPPCLATRRIEAGGGSPIF